MKKYVKFIRIIRIFVQLSPTQTAEKPYYEAKQGYFELT